MGLINAFGALGGLAGAFAAEGPGRGTRSGAAFVLMAAVLSGPAGPVPAPVRAVRGGRLKTI